MPTPSPSSIGLPPLVKQCLDQTKYTSILISQAPSLAWVPSSIYFWPDLLTALGDMYSQGVAGSTFWLGDSSNNGWKYGVVSVAAFLAQVRAGLIRVRRKPTRAFDTTRDYS